MSMGCLDDIGGRGDGAVDGPSLINSGCQSFSQDMHPQLETWSSTVEVAHYAGSCNNVSASRQLIP